MAWAPVSRGKQLILYGASFTEFLQAHPERDGDLRFTGSGWSYHDFRGSRWINVAKTENRNYLLNAYRVLLTRARQGMVIFVPAGDAKDPTRSPEYYDSTFNYLTSIGLPVLA